MQRPREAVVTESGDSDHSEWNAGHSSADSAGDGGSVEPAALGPGDGAAGLLEQRCAGSLSEARGSSFCCCLPTECAYPVLLGWW